MADPIVIIRTVKFKTGEVLSDHRYALDLRGHNRLARHIAWATKNGHGVQVFNQLDQGKANAL